MLPEAHICSLNDGAETQKKRWENENHFTSYILAGK